MTFSQRVHDETQALAKPLHEVISNSEQLILVGLDGVLIESEPEAHIVAHLDAMRDVFDLYIARDDFWRAAEDGMTDRRIAMSLMRYAGKDIFTTTADEVEAWRSRLGELFARYSHLADSSPERLPHVQKGLRMVKNSKTSMLLATGNLEQIARDKLKETNLEEYFPQELGSFGDFHLERKRVVQEALLLAGWADSNGCVLPEKAQVTWLIGDTIKDIEAAKLANVRSIGITTGAFGYQELKAAGAEAVFMRFDRAVEYVLDQAWYRGFTTAQED